MSQPTYDGPAGGHYDPSRDPSLTTEQNSLVLSLPPEQRAAVAAVLRDANASAPPPVPPAVPAQGQSFFRPDAPFADARGYSNVPAGLTPAVSEAQGVRGGGVAIPLRSGAKQLTYDFLALLAMEEEFGSIQGMQDAMEDFVRQGMKGPFLTSLVRLLHIGLTEHYPPGPDGRRALARDMELDRLPEYMPALESAVSRAFGSGSGRAGGGGAPGPSRGDGSTTSPSSPPASPLTPSGA